MDKQQAAKDIITAALPHVVFDGWNQATLHKAAQDAGYKKTDVIRVFPQGAVDAVDVFLHLSDEAMAEALSHYHLEGMKIREKITLAVKLRIEVHMQHREAVRRTIGFLALPHYSWLSLKALHRTVDNIWYAIGDASTDFNFYTKRMTLAGVYTSTLLCWLDDKSPGHEQTWQFLDRRIADVMVIEKLKQKVRGLFSRVA
ncbi:MAG: COQ9 family protein [Alphaproteobacteria bacterium]